MLGIRLKRARQGRCLSLRQLAAKAGLSHNAISKYERELDTPGSGALIKLAKALEVKPEYFFRQDTREYHIKARFRCKKELPPKQIKAMYGKIAEWLERYEEIESYFPSEQKAHQPLETFRRKISGVEEMETLAGQLRAEWNVGNDAIGNLTELVESFGIKVGVFDTIDDLVGCVFTVGENVPVIAVAKGIPGDRERFTIAHELGHLLIEEENGGYPEGFFDRFAGAFLVPRECAFRELGLKRKTLGRHELEILKKKYGLSMKGWIHRAHDLGIIPEGYAEKCFRFFKNSGFDQTEPGEQFPFEEPSRLQRLVLRALVENLVSESKAADLLNLSVAELRKSLEGKDEEMPFALCR